MMEIPSYPMVVDFGKTIGLFEVSQLSPVYPSHTRNVSMEMSMERWWNDTDRGKLKYWEKNIIQRGW
jgi:hypothetical protein